MHPPTEPRGGRSAAASGRRAWQAPTRPARWRVESRQQRRLGRRWRVVRCVLHRRHQRHRRRHRRICGPVGVLAGARVTGFHLFGAPVRDFSQEVGCVGHIDNRGQDDTRCALRSATHPRRFVSWGKACRLYRPAYPTARGHTGQPWATQKGPPDGAVLRHDLRSGFLTACRVNRRGENV